MRSLGAGHCLNRAGETAESSSVAKPEGRLVVFTFLPEEEGRGTKERRKRVVEKNSLHGYLG